MQRDGDQASSLYLLPAPPALLQLHRLMDHAPPTSAPTE